MEVDSIQTENKLMKTIKINNLTKISSLLLIISTFLSPAAVLSEIILDDSMGSAGLLAGSDYQITENLVAY